jgi:anhydro-N-acetylmuramic acid kinase
MDGIDVAMIASDGEGRVERGASAEFPFDGKIRRQIEMGLVAARCIGKDRNARPDILAKLEHDLTVLHVEAIVSFLDQHDLNAGDIDVIGFHGQTVLHWPEAALTVQLGDGLMLARQTGIDVVCDMRAADMVAGGQGAPLVPVYHRALARSLPPEILAERPVAFVNIGGISNITFVPESGNLIAFDTGPGNALIDQWVQARANISYDKGGEIAKSGQIIEPLLHHHLASPYFQKGLPKSLDRSEFLPPRDESLSLADGARTLAHFTARSIFAAIEHLPEAPKLWIICGGGRKNEVIMSDLQKLAQSGGGKVLAAEEVGFNGDAMEAEAFAYLAIRSLKGLPLTFPGTTGCNAATMGGVMCEA